MSKKNIKVVVIAGGKGTRIASVNSEIPKAMIPVGGKPILEHQVELARRYGLTDFIFLTGHLGNVIEDYFGNGSKWGVNIEYYRETRPLGTAGAIAEIKDDLPENFFVFYGDTVLDVNLDRMLAFHTSHHADATLMVHPNDHPFDSDIVILVKESNAIKQFANKPHADDFISHNIVNAALFIFNRKIVDFIPQGEKCHIEKDILPACLANGLHLYGYISSEYIKDMGTPDRYAAVCKDWQSGRVAGMNYSKKRKAVFLDRDGVLNEDIGLVYQPSQLKLIDGVEEGLQYLHKRGYIAVVVTNQSVIARNLCTFEELDAINAQLETLLGKKHAYIDALYFCPHHPDGGYPEERKEYKIACECRKPAPGLLLRAASELNIDLSKSIMIGDRDSDVQAGLNAKVKASLKIPANTAGVLAEVLKKELR